MVSSVASARPAAAAALGPPAWKRLAPRDGLPELQVLLTWASTINFLKDRDGCTAFGLDLEYRSVFQKGTAPPLSALVQIASGSRLLLFDLHEYRLRGRTSNLPPAFQFFSGRMTVIHFMEWGSLTIWSD